jgi:hypothetical protein
VISFLPFRSSKRSLRTGTSPSHIGNFSEVADLCRPSRTASAIHELHSYLYPVINPELALRYIVVCDTSLSAHIDHPSSVLECQRTCVRLRYIEIQIAETLLSVSPTIAASDDCLYLSPTCSSYLSSKHRMIIHRPQIPSRAVTRFASATLSRKGRHR